MNFDESSFMRTRLWTEAFRTATPDERSVRRLESAYLQFREKAATLANEVARDFPNYTVHDITHLDGLWDVADLISGGDVHLNPAETFVLGGAFLIHDLAMGASAHAEGLHSLRDSTMYKDILAMEVRRRTSRVDAEATREEIADAEQITLRETHAKHAESLAIETWRSGDGEAYQLIENDELRRFLGPYVGRIAYSHWWSFDRVRSELNERIGGVPSLPPMWDIDLLKIAALMRAADAAHIDGRRAPGFLKAIRRVSGYSELHWRFQEKILRPVIEGDRLKYNAAGSFDAADADSWWLAYDTIGMIDRELRQIDDFFSVQGRPHFAAKGVLAAGNPSALSRIIPVDGWSPVDARPHISDVTALIGSLGGSALYGGKKVTALRELLQNATDAVRALRALRPEVCDNQIRVHVSVEDDGRAFISVEDHGVGMSGAGITDGLLNFGTSLWSSQLLRREFPGLASSDFRPTGKYGVGFFSVFMLGQCVTVRTRRYDRAPSDTFVVEFRDGLQRRPIVRNAVEEEYLWVAGTVVTVELPNSTSLGFYHRSESKPPPSIIDEIADATVYFVPFASSTIHIQAADSDFELLAVDRSTLSDDETVLRARGPKTRDYNRPLARVHSGLLRQIVEEDGRLVGRAALDLGGYGGFRAAGAVISVGGLRLSDLRSVSGWLLGTPARATRDSAHIEASGVALTVWAKGQRDLVAALRLPDRAKYSAAENLVGLGIDMGDLPIARIGDDYLTRSQVIEWAARRDIIILLDSDDLDEFGRLQRVDFYVGVLATSLTSGYLVTELLLDNGSDGISDDSASRPSLSDVVEAAIATAWGITLHELFSYGYLDHIDDTQQLQVAVGTYRGTPDVVRHSVLDCYARPGVDKKLFSPAITDIDL